MSAPTPSSRPQHSPATRPTVASGSPAAARRLVLPARSPVGTAVDLIARLGTAITLAALLVVTATALGVVDDPPTPTGAATTGR